MSVRIAVVGDYQPDSATHPATAAAVAHAGADLGVATEVSWIGTADSRALAGLHDFDGIWMAPGSPCGCLEGALGAIAFARTGGIPLLGTCAGFQHLVVEYARNVVGDAGAHHAEYAPAANSLFVTPLSCSLTGRAFDVKITKGSRAHAAYGRATAVERYYCNFGLNPEKEAVLSAAGLRVTGRDHTGEARIVELAGHPFFVGTLFVPQLSSSFGDAHPLVLAFVRSAATARDRGGLPSRPSPAPFIPLPGGLCDPRVRAGGVFDRIAELYDRVRPGYPAEAVADVIRSCALTAASRVIEVGCGTGQLTRALAGTGASILAAEPGEALAATARARLAQYGAVEVHTTRFEDLDAPPGSFDLVVAATSFHWVDPAVGYHKAARLLRPDGCLALLTNAHAAGGNHTHPPFADAVHDLHHRLAPTIGDWKFPDAEEIAGRAHAGGDLAAVWARVDRSLGDPPALSGFFDDPTIRTYPWLAAYDRDTYLGLLASQSSYALMGPEQQSELLEGIGALVDTLLDGRVTKQYVTVVATARTLGGPDGRPLPT